MRQSEMKAWFTTLALLVVSLSGAVRDSKAATAVAGIVRMPDVCSPSVSPAVVYLVPADAKDRQALLKHTIVDASMGRNSPAEVVLVNQLGLQFVPRIQAMAVGKAVRFGNKDSETHNVHVVSPGFAFNQSMAPGQFRDFTPAQPGVIRLACDIHMHMRGFVVVSPTPWTQVCDRAGRYRLDQVPDGRYNLIVWHEMGDPVHTEITVAGEKKLDIPELVLTSALGPGGGAGSGRSAVETAPVRRWADVIDRIGVTLAASRDAATRPGELAKARRLADDAYWVEFESSDMETAVNKYLGFGRARGLERQFHAISMAAREVAEKRQAVSVMDELCHKMLLDLSSVATDLNAAGVTDRSWIDALAGRKGTQSELAASLIELSATGPAGDPRTLLESLRIGLKRVEQQAERNNPHEAASELTTVYMTEFEPLERYLLGRNPQVVRPLEIRFNALRGDLTAGKKGEELASQIEALSRAVETVIDAIETRPAGAFGPAFFASLVTILREGVEVILVVTMLLALVARAASGPATPDNLAQGNCSGVKSSPEARVALARASRAIWWGVGLASLASLATAVLLNVLVISASGAVREILEGVVMLAASGILFYVSYWLISQLEAKRWMDFLKKQARHGLELGGQGTLAVTAFLAVYREGAETSLMYQALLASEGRTQAGFLGLSAGLALGIALLAVIAYFIRATSIRLPMHVFFKFSGMFLFALAIVFAGNGVFELQNAGILLTTNIVWIGHGVPWAGLYPNLQVISVQGLLLAGAILAWVVIPRESLQAGTTAGPSIGLVGKRS
jgi:high-affinity iron transporter